MKQLENKLFVLDSDEKYSRIETVSLKKRIYAYLVNINDASDSMFKEICISDDEIDLKDIDKNLFQESIIYLFIEKIELS